MGYTHYWNNEKEIDKDVWNGLIKDVKKVYKGLPSTVEDEPLLLNGCMKFEKPAFNASCIFFNGEGIPTRIKKAVYKKDKEGRPTKVDYYYWETVISDLGHETFSLHRKPKNGFGGGFCKTARKPYDLMVCASLILYHIHIGEDVSSDGDAEEWQDAVNLVNSVLGMNVKVIDIPSGNYTKIKIIKE